MVRANRESRMIWGVTGVYVAAFLFLIEALFKSTEYAILDRTITPHFIFLFCGLLFYILGNELLILLRKYEIIRQIYILNVIGFFLSALFIILGSSDLREIGRQSYIISWSTLAIVFLSQCVRGFSINYSYYSNKLKTNGKIFLINHKWLLGLCFVILCICVAQSGAEPRWDGAYLHDYLGTLCLASVFNIKALSFCDHISMVYCAINVMLGIIFGNLRIGMAIGNIGLFIGSIASVYGIAKSLLKDRSDFECTLLSAVYAASPLLLGLANYSYWDFWVVVLFPIIVYFTISNQWVYHLLFAFIFCFTKETAVVAYAFYVLGLIIVDFLNSDDLQIIGRLKKILKSKKYWGMLIIGLVWLYFYIVFPNWNGEGRFSLDISYIVSKLKVLFILNFNWILVVIGVGGFLMNKRRSKIWLELLPLLLSDFAFVVFSCLFDTVNHARYIDTHIVVLNLFALLSIGMINKKKIRIMLSTCVILVMLLSNYRTFDPLTLFLFDRYDVGTTTMISTSSEILSDSMVYNQQYQYFDKALDLALKDPVHEDTSLILFPIINGREWFFEGLWSDADLDAVGIGYWDDNREKRVRTATEYTISFRHCYVTEESDINSILDDSIGYYFYLSFAGSEIAEYIRDEMMVLEEEEFNYRGFKVLRMKFIGGGIIK